MSLKEGDRSASLEVPGLRSENGADAEVERKRRVFTNSALERAHGETGSSLELHFDYLELAHRAQIEDNEFSSCWSCCGCLKSPIGGDIEAQSGRTKESWLGPSRSAVVPSGYDGMLKNTETSVTMKFPCYCVKVADILEMKTFIPFEQLQAQGKLHE